MKDNKILFGTMIVLLLLLTVGLSYAYFSTAVKGNDNAKDVVVEAGTLKLTYTDGPAINAQNIKPGWSTTKEVSVKNNGTLDANYNVIWQSLTNGIINDELVLSATCQRLNASGTVEGTCESISQAPISDMTIAKKISIESGVTHKYTFTILFKETNSNQNYNQGKEFNGVIGIEEYKDATVYCTYDGELAQGVEYVNGQYIYRYKQEGEYASSGIRWRNITSDGWGVQLTDKTSTDVVTSTICTYINNKPIVSMSNMFGNSQALSINTSNFDTSKVTSMLRMFGNSQVTTLDLSNFDTSNVTNMGGMFAGYKGSTLDLSSFNTSKVTDMGNMFATSNVKMLDLSNFNTSKVYDMSYMFSGSQATTLDLSNFDTSEVGDMSFMFADSQATIIKGLENFNTISVGNMGYMFSKSNVKMLDLSNFNTSEVGDMSSMFADSQATTIDLSSFDTSNITDMSDMFSYSKAITIDLSSFDTSNVTDMSFMFRGCQAVTIDLSSFDTSKVTNMLQMFAYSENLKTIYASDKFVTATVEDSECMFEECTNLVGGNRTRYHDSNANDKTYACLDGVEGNYGYFTAK